MTDWARYQRMLANARAAGDTQAVQEIEAEIAAVGQESKTLPAREQETPYDKDRYRRMLRGALEAKDYTAAEEIGLEWMQRADAAGRTSPLKFTDEELQTAPQRALNAGDLEGFVLTTIAAKNRGIKPPTLLDDAGKAVGQTWDAILGIPGAVQSGVDNFGRGAARLASGEADLEDLGGAINKNVVAGLRNIPGADLLHAGGENITRFFTGQENNPNALREARAKAAAAAEEAPLGALAGELAGAGIVANRVLGVPGMAVVPGGGAVANTARVAASGGAAEGITGLVDTLDPAEAAKRAVVGAVAAPAVGAVANKVIDTIGAPAARALRGETPKAGLKKLAQIVKRMPVAELENLHAKLAASRATGTNPGQAALAEVVNTEVVQRAQSVIKTQRRVAARATQAREAAEMGRPTELKRKVAEGGRLASADAPRNARSANFTKMMETHGGRPVEITNPAYFDRPAIRQELKLQAENSVGPDKDVLLGFLEALEGNRGPMRPTLREVESLRGTLAKVIDQKPTLKDVLEPVRDKLENIASGQIPEYGAAMRQFRTLGDVAEGIETGRRGVTGSIEDLREALANTPKNVNPRAKKAGVEIGFRTRVAEDVGDSFGRSEQAAEALRSPAFRTRAEMTLGPDEARRIAEGADMEARAARNLRMLDPAPDPQATRPGNPIGSVADLGAAAGPSGVGFKVGAIRAFINEFKDMGMLPQTAKGLAEGLFDPATAPEALATLARLDRDGRIAKRLSQLLATVQVSTQGDE